MNARFGFTLAALAALCLLAAPAFSMPGAWGGFKHEGNCPMIGNLTAEQMGNMTLGELKELMKQSRNNSTSCPMSQGAMNCGSGKMGSNMGGNNSPARGMDMKMGASEGQKNGRNQNGRMMGGNDDGRNMNGRNMDGGKMMGSNMDGRNMGGSNMSGSSCRFGGMSNFGGEDKRAGHHGDNGIDGSMSLLWYGDITLEKLGDMTVNQIRELKQSWMKEMDGMTLNELDSLKEKKIQEMNNMTVNEISEMKKNNRQISRIINSVETVSEEA